MCSPTTGRWCPDALGRVGERDGGAEMIEAPELGVLLLDHEATGLHLGIVEDPGGEVRIGDLTRHASAVQSVEQIADAPLPEAQFEEGRQLAPMRRPGRGVSESWIVGEGTLPEDIERSGPVLVAEGGQAQPPVGRLV